jgi:hypothetical protein
MQGKTKEHWIKLCIQASTEQDPDELLRLIREINDVLEEKQLRLRKIQAVKDGQERASD